MFAQTFSVSFLIAWFLPRFYPTIVIYLSSKSIFFISFLAQACLHGAWGVYLCHYFSPLRKLPLAPQGSIFQRFFQEPTTHDFTRWINEVPNDGLIRYYGAFNSERVLVASPDAVKEVVQNKCYDFVKREMISKVLKMISGDGIVSAVGEKHKMQRKVIQPAFKFKNIQELYPLFWSETLRFMGLLQQHMSESKDFSKSPKVDLADWSSRATLDIFTLAAFGGSYHALENPRSTTKLALESVFHVDRHTISYIKFAALVPSYAIWSRLPFTQRYRWEKANAQLRADILPLIKERQHEMQHPTSVLAEAVKKSTAYVDILAKLLQSPFTFSQDQLLDQVITFLGAGHDTTSTGLTFTIYLLATRPDLQRQLRDQIRSVLASPNDTTDPPPSSVWDTIPLLSAVIAESLRLYAPIPNVSRKVSARHGIDILGTHIPNGTEVMCSPWASSRSKAIFGEDALEFKPERFLLSDPNAPTGVRFDPLCGLSNKYAYIVFSGGPRSCIGENFAKAELKALVSAMVGRWEWSLGPGVDAAKGVEIVHTFVSRPKENGVWLNAKVVEGW